MPGACVLSLNSGLLYGIVQWLVVVRYSAEVDQVHEIGSSVFAKFDPGLFLRLLSRTLGLSPPHWEKVRGLKLQAWLKSCGKLLCLSCFAERRVIFVSLAVQIEMLRAVAGHVDYGQPTPAWLSAIIRSWPFCWYV